MVKVKVVGICGSQRKGRNTEYLVKQALEAAEELGDVETELITLCDKKISPCTACYKCDLVGDEEDRICPEHDDDFNSIITKLIDADGIIIGSPVYMGDVPANLKAFFDRCESIGEYVPRDRFKQVLRNRVGGAIVTGSVRHGGQEHTIDSIHKFFLFNGLLVVGSCEAASTFVGSPWGGVGILWPHGSSLTPGAPVKEDKLAVRSSRYLGRRVALVAKLVKPGSAKEREEWLKWSVAQIEKPMVTLTKMAKKEKSEV